MAASLLALVLSGCTMWEQKQSTAWSNATGAEQFERLLWQEIKAGNWSEVERRLAPTFVEVTAGGVHDRAQALDRLKALQVADYSMGDLEVRPNGNDMVVAYTITLRLPSGGDTTLRMMTVWQQVKGGWIAISHSETTAAPR
ncbi:MAG: nuclear transport factor 2 family protein [Terriglobales bacterium]